MIKLNFSASQADRCQIAAFIKERAENKKSQILFAKTIKEKAAITSAVDFAWQLAEMIEKGRMDV